jgi:phosphatidylinositol dimannoside acyltransferase
MLDRFKVKGVFWRQFLRWAVLNVPGWIEPAVIGWWSAFFLLWGPGRRGVMRNLRAIKPGSRAPANFLRTFRVFWNYAWTITDAARFKELRVIPEWEFEGREHFEPLLTARGGGIILTAHMGSYDLGAHLFAASTSREIVMIRAPEVDPQTRAYEEARLGDEHLRVGFNTSSALAFDLLDAIQRGELVAIQGDRVTPGIASQPATLFGRRVLLPAGPFALAMAARVPIHPMFVVRTGRRRYRLISHAPIVVERRSRNREADLQIAIDAWAAQLEQTIRQQWFQWFTFEPALEEPAA